MYYADNLWDAAMQDVREFLRTVKKELFENWVIFRKPENDTMKDATE